MSEQGPPLPAVAAADLLRGCRDVFGLLATT